MIQRLLLHIACLLLPFAVTSAQKQDTTRSLNLGEVEVRGAQTLRTVNSTAPTYQLERDQLLRQGVSDMGEALHRLPGITLRDYGGAGGMKTVSVRGFGASHTGVSYDGVVLSECQSGEIDLSRYSIDQVERLQLTIGDNDDLFLPARQAATPALLSIETTHRPDSQWAQRLTSQVKVGSFGYVSPFLRYERNLRQKLWLMACGEYTYAENDYPFTLENGATAWITPEKATQLCGYNNLFNGIAGIINIFLMTGWWNTFASKDGKDMLWPDMTWVYIITYDLWNFCYTYNCLPNHAWYCGIALLLAPTVANFLWNKGAWIQNRANTLATWCMFAQIFPMFQDDFAAMGFPELGSSPFAVASTLNPTTATTVAAIALIANVLGAGYLIYRVTKLKRNPYTNDIFVGTRDYEQARARMA